MKSSCCHNAGLAFYRIVLVGQKFSSTFKLLGFPSSQPTSHVHRPDYYAFVQKTVLIYFPQRTLKGLLFLCCVPLTVDEVSERLFLSFLKTLWNTLWDLQKKVSNFLLLPCISTEYPREWIQLCSEPQPVRNDHVLVCCGSQSRLLMFIIVGMDKQPDSACTSWSKFWL